MNTHKGTDDDDKTKKKVEEVETEKNVWYGST